MEKKSVTIILMRCKCGKLHFTGAFSALTECTCGRLLIEQVVSQ